MDARKGRAVGAVMDAPDQATVPGLRRARPLVEPDPVRQQVREERRVVGAVIGRPGLGRRRPGAGCHEGDGPERETGAPCAHDAAPAAGASHRSSRLCTMPT